MYKKLVAGLFVALIAVPAFAADSAFDKIDTDKDGSISRSEAMAAGISDEAFVQADINQDKKLNVDEYTVFTKG